MMTATQPIALPGGAHDGPDVPMSSGSYTGNSGSFNQASYTRRFLGSPLSFRSGSFGSRFYPGCSPGQLLGPLDPTDFKFGKLSSSVESERGSILNALNILEREDEMCRNYTCCGLNLTDLHALLEHFEECHVVVVDPYAPPQHFLNQNPEHVKAAINAATAGAAYYPDAQNTNNHYHHNASSASEHSNPMLQIPQGYHQGPFDPDDMELDVDNSSTPSSGAPSPPETPITTPISTYPSPNLAPNSIGFHHYTSNPASTSSSACPSPISAFDTTTVLSSRSSLLSVSTFPRTNEMFNNGYCAFDGMMSSGMVGEGYEIGSNGPMTAEGCVPPALLFSASSTPITTPSTSRVNSPAPPSSYFSGQAGSSLNPNKSNTPSSPSASTPRASTTLSRPSSSLLLSKPFKCPKPNCNKSYKQANGLKYHMTHGSCNFGPAKELGEVQAVLKEREDEVAAAGGGQLSEREMMEVEREAERRLRPFACGVSECQRRYKNMNGLRYHYQHSGDHGAIGLALLASGQHECLRSAHGRRDGSREGSRNSTPVAATQRQSQSTFQATAQVQQPQYSQPQSQQQSPQQAQQQFAAAAYALQGQQQPQQPQWTQSMMMYGLQMQQQQQQSQAQSPTQDYSS